MWDSNSKQWSHSCATEFQRGWFLYLSEENEKAWIILSQFTGLIDKKHHEIYEGDMVIWKTSLFWMESKLEPVRVDWNQEQCGWTLHGYYGTRLVDFYELEIIWNIYENPELLN
jgi:hypothetical protein